MDSAPVRGDSTEKTITLGLLDLMPATRQALPVEQFPSGGVRLAAGFSVLVQGARVIRERPRPADEASFVMRPSAWLRARRGARDALRALYAWLSALPSTVALAFAALVGRGAPQPPAARALVARWAAAVTRAGLAELRRGRSAVGTVAADLRVLSGPQRRSVAVAFLAGVVLATLVTSLAL